MHRLPYTGRTPNTTPRGLTPDDTTKMYSVFCKTSRNRQNGSEQRLPSFLMEDFVVKVFAESFLQCVVGQDPSWKLISVFRSVARRVEFEHVSEGDIILPLRSASLREATPSDTPLARLLDHPSQHSLQVVREAVSECRVPISRLTLSGVEEENGGLDGEKDGSLNKDQEEQINKDKGENMNKDKVGSLKEDEGGNMNKNGEEGMNKGSGERQDEEGFKDCGKDRRDKNRSRSKEVLHIFLARAQMMQETFSKLVRTGHAYGATKIMDQIILNVTCHGLEENTSTRAEAKLWYEDDNIESQEQDRVGFGVEDNQSTESEEKLGTPSEDSKMAVADTKLEASAEGKDRLEAQQDTVMAKAEANLKARAEDSIATLRSLVLATHLLRLVRFHKGRVCLQPEVEERLLLEEEKKRQQEEEKERIKEEQQRSHEDWSMKVNLIAEQRESDTEDTDKQRKTEEQISMAFTDWEDSDWEDMNVEVIDEIDLEGKEIMEWEGEGVKQLMKERKKKKRKKKKRNAHTKNEGYCPPLSEWCPVLKSEFDFLNKEMLSLENQRLLSKTSSLPAYSESPGFKTLFPNFINSEMSSKSGFTNHRSAEKLDVLDHSVRNEQEYYIQDSDVKNKEEYYLQDSDVKNTWRSDIQDDSVQNKQKSDLFSVENVQKSDLQESDVKDNQKSVLQDPSIPSHSPLKLPEASISVGIKSPNDPKSPKKSIPEEEKNLSLKSESHTSVDFPWPDSPALPLAQSQDPQVAPWILQPNFTKAERAESQQYILPTENMEVGLESILAGKSVTEYVEVKKKIQRRKKGKQGEEEERDEDDGEGVKQNTKRRKGKQGQKEGKGNKKNLQKDAEPGKAEEKEILEELAEIAAHKPKIVKETLLWGMEKNKKTLGTRGTPDLSKQNRAGKRKIITQHGKIGAKELKNGKGHTKTKGRECLQMDELCKFLKKYRSTGIENDERLVKGKAEAKTAKEKDNLNTRLKQMSEACENLEVLLKKYRSLRKGSVGTFNKSSACARNLLYIKPKGEDDKKWNPGYDFHLKPKTQHPRTKSTYEDKINIDADRNCSALHRVNETGDESQNIREIGGMFVNLSLAGSKSDCKYSAATVNHSQITDIERFDVKSSWGTGGDSYMTDERGMVWELEGDSYSKETSQSSVPGMQTAMPCKEQCEVNKNLKNRVNEACNERVDFCKDRHKCNIGNERLSLWNGGHEQKTGNGSGDSCNEEHKHKTMKHIISLKVIPAEAGMKKRVSNRGNTGSCLENVKEEWECHCAGVMDKKTGKPWTATAHDYHRLVLEELQRASEGKQEEDESEEWCRFLGQQATSCATLQLLSVSHHCPLKVEVGGHTHNSKEWAFILYNYSRLCGIFETFDYLVSQGELPPLPQPHQLDFSLLRHDEEWALVWAYVIRWPEVVEAAGRELLSWAGGKDRRSGQLKTGTITRFLSRLAHSTSRYYARHHVLPSDPSLSHLHPLAHARLHLLHALHAVMKIALSLLGIDSPPVAM